MRFKPGQSGHPRGRPKGAKSKPPKLNEERLKDMILAEAYRPIKVADGPMSAAQSRRSYRNYSASNSYQNCSNEKELGGSSRASPPMSPS